MRFQGLDLNLLVAFDILMEERSVRRAAQRLRLSQPATSSALARLRTFFSDPILVLEGKRMYSTPYADSLLPHVRECLRTASALIAMSGGFDPAVSSRVFRISTSDYMVAALFAPLARKLSTLAPNIVFELSLPDMSAMQKLERGDIDLMITPSQFVVDSCVCLPLLEEEHVVVGCRDNPIFGQPMTEGQFFAAGHVAVAVGPDRIPAYADRQLALMNRERRIEMTAGSFAVLPWLVMGTRRLAMMQKRLADEMGQHLRFSQAPLPFEMPVMLEMIQYHRSRAGDEGMLWLTNLLQQEGLVR